MSDNVSKMQPQKPKGLLRRVVLLVLVVVLVAVGVLAYCSRDKLSLGALRRWFRRMDLGETGSQGDFSFDAHSSNLYKPLGGGLAVASVTGAAVYDDTGEQLALLQTPFATPCVSIGGNCALVYDVSGYALHTVHRTKGPIIDLTAARPILDADISKGDWVCYSTQETGYKSVLCVCSPSGATTYRWLSSSRYLPLCTVSDTGSYLAAVALGQKDGIFESSLLVFKTDSEEIYNSFSLGNELVYDVEFYGDELVCVVCESCVLWMRLDGTMLGRCGYGEAHLKDFDFGGSSFVTLRLTQYQAGSRDSIVLVGFDGKTLGNVGVGQELMDFAAAGDYTAVLTTGQLTIFDADMKILAQADNSWGASHLVLRADGSAILLTNGHGWLYQP